VAVDGHDRRVILFASDWELRYFQRHHPDVVLLDESPVTTAKTRPT
jgi:peptide subunit release factor RF-3